ncbi:SulP family inorganic anion transporter [Acidithiobacillus sp.]|jgi:SulP family sulfate permease|uniref:SulP family inorganic anion transporter n=1 Tax=Acidithiobacillus sp. TaxID=1872118 RepID=UPI0025BEFB76|nr:SulP family inorganic anion transporter [Acidithiobacillus sp.]MCK9189160.1 SulP family inorganic anion transporter [Acidithiobacillus sp.]MCK9359602.1 SulP family inorganic anion transporter [Acidithiobacillus sp.]
MQSLSRFEENKINILSGITVALALVPEAIAFAFVAHVSPLTGLYAAVILVFITSLWGGRPGMVSGASGATAVVMVALVVSHGTEYLFAAVILMGLLQLFFAAARLSKFVRLIPHPVMLGFINGLAIVIFMAQLEHFKVKDAQGAMVWMHGTPLYIMIGLVALTMVAIYLTPRVTKAIPATLAGALLTTLLVVVFKIPTVTVGDVASLAGGLPIFHLPEVPLTWHTLVVIFPYALVMAANGLVETLLTLNLIDEMTDTRGKPNQESMAQGLANVVSGFFGAMGGCAMLGESIINVGNGAIKRLSGITTALFLLSFIVLASHWIQQVPIAALVGVMFVVVEKTFEWSSLRFFGRVPRTDIVIGILVAAITVLVNITLAVVAGVIIAALAFAWQHAKQIEVKTSLNTEGHKIYTLQGTLFFASVSAFRNLFTPAEDPDVVIIDFAGARIIDHSAIEAIDTLAERYEKRCKKLYLRHLSGDCRDLLEKAKDLVVFNVAEDPRYHVADD